jgi:hypothetical protein
VRWLKREVCISFSLACCRCTTKERCERECQLVAAGPHERVRAHGRLLYFCRHWLARSVIPLILRTWMTYPARAL